VSRLELQELYELAECNFASRKGTFVRCKRTIPHPSRKGLALSTNFPLPYAVTVVSNDDMKRIAQVHHTEHMCIVFPNATQTSALVSLSLSGARRRSRTAQPPER
jgi:hypothetical protein